MSNLIQSTIVTLAGKRTAALREAERLHNAASEQEKIAAEAASAIAALRIAADGRTASEGNVASYPSEADARASAEPDPEPDAGSGRLVDRIVAAMPDVPVHRSAVLAAFPGHSEGGIDCSLSQLKSAGRIRGLGSGVYARCNFSGDFFPGDVDILRAVAVAYAQADGPVPLSAVEERTELKASSRLTALARAGWINHVGYNKWAPVIPGSAAAW
jgi:hypothetical protein